MPKSSPGKKRKKEASKEDTSNQPKKQKWTKKRQASEKADGKFKKHLKDKNIDHSDSEEDACSGQSLDIDQELDKNASKSNLSVFNVKSIIHHVLSDERVVAMARKAAEKDDNDDDNDSTKGETHSVLPSIMEPKLTRSRVRQVAQTIGTAPDPLLLVKETIIQSPVKNVISPFKLKRKTPEKINSPYKLGEYKEDDRNIIREIEVPLADLNFSEGGSSDEEYDPLNDDGSEDDSESCVSNTSDLASPEPLRRTSRAKRRLMTDSVSSPQPDDSQKDGDVALKTDQEEELSSPFKVPLPLTKSAEKKENAKTDLIATRTRSRLPLTDTSLESIEAQFIPPDLTPDLYDIINLEDLEQDDIDWHKWLFGLNAEKGATDTDDPEDSEYNFMAEDQKEEQEEYRTDRAVKISQKELTELFEQFLTEFGDEIPMEDITSSCLQTQSTLVAPVHYGEEIGMTLQQRQCLITQLQKHTQLLVQVSLLCKGRADLSFVAETCEGVLQDMVRLNDVASSNYVSRLVDNKDASPTVFSSVGLNEAVRVINQPRSSITPVGTPSTSKPSDESRETTAAPPIPEEVVKIITSSPIFICTGLLPHIPFHTQKTSSGRGEKFLQCEDNLLVLGIDQYGHDWTQIKKHYLPAKTLKQIKIRRKNLCSNRAPDNVVKQYRNTGKIPILPRIPAISAMEERVRPAILPASNEKGTSPLWFKKLNEQQTPQSLSSKKIAKRKKNVKTNDVTMSIISPPSFTDKIPTIILKDPTCDMDATKDVVVNSQPPLPDTSKNSQVKNMNAGDSKSPARTDISSSKEKMRTILPNPKPSPKDTQQVPTPRPQSLQNEILNREWSSPLNDIPTGVTTDHAKCTILQGSEKENIQPVSEETRIENVDDCNTESLRTDTNEDIKIRAISYAQSYLNNVKKEVKEDSPTYQAFLKVLVDSKFNIWSPAMLYKEIAVVLKDFPYLVRDFAGFLEPHQALDAGVFMTNKEILKARIFLQRVESHFSKNPSHFQKIIKAFSTFNLQESKSSQLYDAVIPLLKGQQYLIEEFNSFFNRLKPQPSHSDDFEEVELGSGSEIEVDDFEEVIVPDVKKNLTKTREFGKTPMKPPGRTMSRKHRRVKKDDANDKNVDGNVIDYDKDNDITEDIADRPEEVNDDIGDNYDKALDSDEDYDEPIDKINSDSETREVPNDTESMSLLTKYTSDLSNPSSPASECKSVDGPFDEDYIESPETTQESQVTSASEAASDLSNEATDVPALSNASPNSLERCENREQTEETPHIKAGNVYKESDVISKPEDVDCSPERAARGSTQATEEICKEGSEIINKEECLDDFNNRISANNLEVDEDGKSVIWTREDDKKILQLCQTRGLSNNIYEDIAQELGNKTAAQVKGRFRVLVSLLPGDNNGNSSSDQSGSESDEESCDETEEN